MDGHAYRVEDVMTRRVIALAGGATFKDIVRTMETQLISALPVIDSGSHVIGVVSEADVLRKEEFRDSDQLRGPRSRPPGALVKARAVTAEDLMTAPAVTVHPKAPVARAARLMARRRVKRLPVVDDEGVLQGIVSRADLLRVFLRSDPDIAEEVRREIVGGGSRKVSDRSVWRCTREWSPSPAGCRTPRSFRWPNGWCAPSRASWTCGAC